MFSILRKSIYRALKLSTIGITGHVSFAKCLFWSGLMILVIRHFKKQAEEYFRLQNFIIEPFVIFLKKYNKGSTNLLMLQRLLRLCLTTVKSLRAGSKYYSSLYSKYCTACK